MLLVFVRIKENEGNFFFHENLSGRLLGRHALDFSLKLQKLRTNLDMWQSRDNPLWKNINHQILGNNSLNCYGV